MSITHPEPSGIAASRRAALLGLACAGLSACNSTLGGSGLNPVPPTGAPDAAPPAASGTVIGAGSVRVALLLPLTGSGSGASVANSMRNAAELAISEFNGPNIQILVKDDHGTPDGAREAVRAALGEGAELVLGPLFAPTVQAAGEVARQAGRPMIAFSTDSTTASRGVYLLSFLPETDVDRIIGYAAQSGRKSFSALIPETAYGNVVAAAFQQAASRAGARIVTVERYTPGPRVAQAVKRVAETGSDIDALFVPEGADGMPAVASALGASGIDLKRVMLLGTGQWNDPRVLRIPQLVGGVFASPDSVGYTSFAGRYRAKYGADPSRIATLSYDAVALVAALVRTRGSERFTESTLTNPSGFAGQDGIFRFRADGLNERALSVQQVGAGGATTVVSPAPKSFTGS